MDIAALIISILALLGSAFVYFQHDRKLKKQEAILNDLQVSEIEKAKEDRMKAKVRMDTQYIRGGSGLLILLNEGNAEARNIAWRFDKRIFDGLKEEGSYEKLIPKQRISFNYSLFDNPKTKCNVTITWDDDHSNNNSITITLYALNRAGYV